jgi:acetyl-CoA carboxylase carboxyltransferase component
LALLVAHDRYDGQAPGAGVITGVGVVAGREVVVVANDATVKAGAWWPETIPKMLRPRRSPCDSAFRSSTSSTAPA